MNSTAKVGVYNPGIAPGTRRGFYLDNGDKVINGCPPDFCFFTDTISLAEDIPIAGDWNGDGIVSIGVFRPSTSSFYLSNQNPATIQANGSITGWNQVIPAGPPSFGYQPVVGDWTGPRIVNGNPNTVLISTKMGVYRPSTGLWYLDNGNNSFPGCAEDICPSGFGATNQVPVSFGSSIIRGN